MKNSKVKIIEFTRNMDNICTASAMISTTKGSALEIYEDKGRLKKNNNLPLKVGKMGHVSLLEHGYFTIAFDNVSVFVEQFMIEHRLASYTVKSRRYVDYSDQGFCYPEFKNKSLTEKYKTKMERLFIAYEDLLTLGIPKEDARFLLPYSFRSNFYCTINARELMKVIYSCLYGRGSIYEELRNIGQSLLEQAKEKGLKLVFENFKEIAQFEDSLTQKSLDFVKKESSYIEENKKTYDLSVSLLSSSENMMLDAIRNEILGRTGRFYNLSRKTDYKFLISQINFFEEMLKDGRSRGLETVFATFMIHNITLAGLTHVARHRMQTLIVPDLVEGVEEDKFVLPDSIINNPKASNIYVKTIKNYLDWKSKEEISKEVAPYFLLAGMKISVITTMNLREMVHFFKLRTCYRAQWEIRDIAKQMISLGKKHSDLDVFSRLGAGCFMDGKCPEGQFCCGKQKELRKELQDL